MFFVTGDMHGEYERLSRRKAPGFYAGDYLIVCGDFGLLWGSPDDPSYKYWRDWLNTRGMTILWVDGNHENFDWIDSLPVSQWNGGNVHMVAENIIHLMRGQVFNIEGKSFFTFGGARSHDIQGGVLRRDDPKFREKVRRATIECKPYRIIGESWWEQEIPNAEEMRLGLENLAKVGNKVDYIISHCGSNTMQALIVGSPTIHKAFEGDPLTEYFMQLEEMSFKHWYFGHYHRDMSPDERHHCLYQDIVVLKD